jgi:hypothetical protein
VRGAVVRQLGLHHVHVGDDDVFLFAERHDRVTTFEGELPLVGQAVRIVGEKAGAHRRSVLLVHHEEGEARVDAEVVLLLDRSSRGGQEQENADDALQGFAPLSFST